MRILEALIPEILICSIALFIYLTITMGIRVKKHKKHNTENNENNSKKQEHPLQGKNFLSNIKDLIKKYKNCSNNQYYDFDKELTDILILYEKIGEPITIDIQNEILRALINMNRVDEIQCHLRNMEAHQQTNIISYLIYLSFLLSDYTTNKEEVKIVSQKINKTYNSSFCVSAKEMYILIISNIVIGNINKSLELFEKEEALLECYEKCKIIEFLFAYLFENKQFQEIINHFQKIKNEYIINSIENIKFLIKAFYKLKKFSHIEEFYNKYNKKIPIELYGLFLEGVIKNQNVELSKKIFNIFKNSKFITIASYGQMMNLYSKQKDIQKCFEIFNELKHKFPDNINIIPYFILVKTLFANNEISTAFDIFDKMKNEQKIVPDRALYELIINSCIKNKLCQKGYDYLLMSINDNIKLAKCIYEEIIDLINDSNLIEKHYLLEQINDIIKISNFSSDLHLMNKINNIVEKDNSVASLETRTSLMRKKNSFC